MLYVLALMPPFNRDFLDTVFQPEVERLLASGLGIDKVVLLSGLTGEEAVYPSADDGYSGLRPGTLTQNDHHYERSAGPRMTVLQSLHATVDGERPNPPTSFVAICNVHSQVETQTEEWARRAFGHCFKKVLITRAEHAGQSLEGAAMNYMQAHRMMGAEKAILWPVSVTPYSPIDLGEVAEQVKFHQSKSRRNLTKLGQALPVPVEM